MAPNETKHYVTRWCFRAGNRASGPDFGRIAIGKTFKSPLRPVEGRPEGRFWGFPDQNPAEIKPGGPIRSVAWKHFCATEGNFFRCGAIDVTKPCEFT